MTSSERTMIATLQGLVNSHCSFQIYTLNSMQPDYQIWLDDLKNSYGSINDYFIVSPSGNGYMYPSKFDKNKLKISIIELALANRYL